MSSSSRAPCRFYRQGKCTNGRSCRFSHDYNAPEPEKQSAPCKFFMQGLCKNGALCVFSHDVKSKRTHGDGPGGSRHLLEKPSGPAFPLVRRDPLHSRSTAASESADRTASPGTAPPPVPLPNPWTTGGSGGGGNDGVGEVGGIGIGGIGGISGISGSVAPAVDVLSNSYVPSAGRGTGAGRGVAEEFGTLDLQGAFGTDVAGIAAADGSGGAGVGGAAGDGLDGGADLDNLDEESEAFMRSMMMGDSGVFADDDFAGTAAPRASGAGPLGAGVRGGEGALDDLDEDPDQLCDMHIEGRCPMTAEECFYVHGDVCPHCKLAILHPYFPEESAQHVLSCEVEMSIIGQIQSSREATCSVCLENIIERGQKFGLLENCNHSFCLECIRAWRTTYDQSNNVVRQCPVCRTHSYLVTPCAYLPQNAESKEAVIDAYKEKLATIPCKHFAYGEGACPFGTSCFFQHLYRDGSKPEAPAFRKTVDADGSLAAAGQVTLSDFFSSRPAGRPRPRNATPAS